MVVTARTTPPSGLLPFHTVIRFIFIGCDGGDMVVNNASNHTGNPEGNSDYWVTSRGHRKMLSSELHLSDIASFKPIFTPLTYSAVILLFLRMSVRGMHTFLKICIQRNYNVLCISGVLKCIFLVLQIIFQCCKELKNILVYVYIKIIFLTLLRTILLGLCKMHLKTKSPRKQD